MSDPTMERLDAYLEQQDPDDISLIQKRSHQMKYNNQVKISDALGEALQEYGPLFNIISPTGDPVDRDASINRVSMINLRTYLCHSLIRVIDEIQEEFINDLNERLSIAGLKINLEK